MRALVQRVSRASVRVGEETVGEIGHGLLTLLGVGEGDGPAQVEWIMRKILALRIFEDDAGKMNLSLKEVAGSHLIVSQFTLYGDCTKGNRPSFMGAARPELAGGLYEHALKLSAESGIPTAGGRFQAEMQVSLINEGPVTLWLQSPDNL
jgi:D-tyrosyl-tRNA(Tyr) deacylase